MLDFHSIQQSLAFFAPMVFLLGADLYFHKKNPTQTFKQALLWSVLWVAIALVFNGYVYWDRGLQSALTFLTGYVVEMSLSVDNLFVIMLIFTFFKVPKLYQHRVLFWGIFGAFVMRAFFIFAGVSLIQRFEWTVAIFGVFLVITGIKTAIQDKEQGDPSHNPVVRLFKKVFPVTNEYHGKQFFIKEKAQWLATPLFVALLVVEVTDLVFAVDSIPAILGITTDPFIVVTSNFFAILGLRSLYFVLEHFLKYFHYLRYGLGFILAFVGLKMVAAHWVHIPVFLSLLVIFLTLIVTIALSLAFPPRKG
jgi:tellurite resistance protein TerC